MRHFPPDWETTTATQNDCPVYAHKLCPGLIILTRPDPSRAADVAQCEHCGQVWTRKNARYLWAPSRLKNEEKNA